MGWRQGSEELPEPRLVLHCFHSLASDLGSIAEMHCISTDCIDLRGVCSPDDSKSSRSIIKSPHR